MLESAKVRLFLKSASTYILFVEKHTIGLVKRKTGYATSPIVQGFFCLYFTSQMSLVSSSSSKL